MNVVLVSHCDFTGNSALHVYSIASELYRRGLSPIVAVPENAESVEDVGRPRFPVVTYPEVLVGALRFTDGRGPDLIHAFTPRELVRKLTVELVRTYRCRYVVHLEDNETAILAAELRGADVTELSRLPTPMLDRIIGPHQSHPQRSARLLDYAAGVTVVIDRLLEFVPGHVPAAIVGAGFDESVLSAHRPRQEVRAELGVAPDELVVLYTGNIHTTNIEDMRDLYLAVAQLRRDGHRAVLVKTGWKSPDARQFPKLGPGIRDLGWVPRSLVPELLQAADVLVQPGSPGAFNDYRLPSKLPEFLASGRPVVLPRTNLGLELRDGIEALVLDRLDAQAIAAAVARLATDPELRSRIGEGGRAFAVRNLRWKRSVDRIEHLYREIATACRPPAPGWALAGTDPPLKIIAFVPGTPSRAEARLARAHGIFGFCLAPTEPSSGVRDFAYCLQINGSDPERLRGILPALFDATYIRVRGAPLLLTHEVDAIAEIRDIVVRETGMPIHFALTDPSDRETPGFDAMVETVPHSDVAEYGSLMTDHLAIPLPEHPWYRGIAFPTGEAPTGPYRAWLRKLVLQTLLRVPHQEPLVFLDASREWPDPVRREALLFATRSGLRDGLGQFYASKRLDMLPREIDEISAVE